MTQVVPEKINFKFCHCGYHFDDEERFCAMCCAPQTRPEDAILLEDAINDIFCCGLFKMYSEECFDAENLAYIKDAEKLKKLADQEAWITEARRMLQQYIVEGAPSQLNIDHSLRISVGLSLEAFECSRDVYEPVTDLIIRLMKQNTWPRFQRSRFWALLLEDVRGREGPWPTPAPNSLESKKEKKKKADKSAPVVENADAEAKADPTKETKGDKDSEELSEETKPLLPQVKIPIPGKMLVPSHRPVNQKTATASAVVPASMAKVPGLPAGLGAEIARMVALNATANAAEAPGRLNATESPTRPPVVRSKDDLPGRPTPRRPRYDTMPRGAALATQNLVAPQPVASPPSPILGPLTPERAGPKPPSRSSFSTTTTTQTPASSNSVVLSSPGGHSPVLEPATEPHTPKALNEPLTPKRPLPLTIDTTAGPPTPHRIARATDHDRLPATPTRTPNAGTERSGFRTPSQRERGGGIERHAVVPPVVPISPVSAPLAPTPVRPPEVPFRVRKFPPVEIAGPSPPPRSSDIPESTPALVRTETPARAVSPRPEASAHVPPPLPGRGTRSSETDTSSHSSLRSPDESAPRGSETVPSPSLTPVRPPARAVPRASENDTHSVPRASDEGTPVRPPSRALVRASENDPHSVVPRASEDGARGSEATLSRSSESGDKDSHPPLSHAVPPPLPNKTEVSSGVTPPPLPRTVLRSPMPRSTAVPPPLPGRAGPRASESMAKKDETIKIDTDAVKTETDANRDMGHPDTTDEASSNTLASGLSVPVREPSTGPSPPSRSPQPRNFRTGPSRADPLEIPRNSRNDSSEPPSSPSRDASASPSNPITGPTPPPRVDLPPPAVPVRADVPRSTPPSRGGPRESSELSPSPARSTPPPSLRTLETPRGTARGGRGLRMGPSVSSNSLGIVASSALGIVASSADSKTDSKTDQTETEKTEKLTEKTETSKTENTDNAKPEKPGKPAKPGKPLRVPVSGEA